MLNLGQTCRPVVWIHTLKHLKYVCPIVSNFSCAHVAHRASTPNVEKRARSCACACACACVCVCVCMCVCVCHPLCQRVHCHRYRHHLFPKQGGSDPFSSHCLTKTLLIGCDIRRGRSLNVPAEFPTSCYTTFPRFVSWFFMLPPPNLSLQLCRADV